MTSYKLKKLYSEGDFVGWRLEKVETRKRFNTKILTPTAIADFYGKGAKESAKFWKLHLMGKELVK